MIFFAQRSYIIGLVLAVTFLLSFHQDVFSQTSSFDLVNLRTTSPALTEAYDQINIEGAWNEILSFPVPLSEVVLGVIDTDFDENHPEFEGVNTGQALLTRPVKDDSHGTAVMGIIGANNISFPDPNDYESPHMNGILSGVTNNYVLGYRGISEFDFDGMKLVQLDTAVKELAEDLIEGQAKIINMSFGLVREGVLTNLQKSEFAGKIIDEEDFVDYSNTFTKIFTEHPDILFVVAAGNQNIDVENHVPAGVATTDNAIAVGAVNLDDSRRVDIADIKESNFGTGVAVSAPGEDVYAPTGFIEPLGFDDYWNPA